MRYDMLSYSLLGCVLLLAAGVLSPGRKWWTLYHRQCLEGNDRASILEMDMGSIKDTHLVRGPYLILIFLVYLLLFDIFIQNHQCIITIKCKLILCPLYNCLCTVRPQQASRHTVLKVNVELNKVLVLIFYEQYPSECIRQTSAT